METEVNSFAGLLLQEHNTIEDISIKNICIVFFQMYQNYLCYYDTFATIIYFL